METTEEFSIGVEYDRFSTIVDKLKGSVDDKVRSLWLEIYTNIINDRATCRALLIQMKIEMRERQGHAQAPGLIHMETSPQLIKYMERVAKCNDQLLDLLKMVESYEGDSSQMTEDDIFDQIDSSDGD